LKYTKTCITLKHLFFLVCLGSALSTAAQHDSLTAAFFAQLRPGLMSSQTLVSRDIRIDCWFRKEPSLQSGDAVTQLKENARSRTDIDTFFLFLPGEKDSVLDLLCAQDGSRWDHAPIADSLPPATVNNRQFNGYFDLPVLLPPGSGPATLYVSRPVFFRQQRFALFAFSSISGPRNAFGAIIIFEKRNGKWISVADILHWVS
jgi:hypothetical protein